MTEVENAVVTAEKIIRDLEEKRECLFSRAKLLAKQREQISYAAHTGDKTARSKLNQINVEASTNGSEIESVQAALNEARARLKAAQQAQASAADRANALALREKLAKFKELGAVLDDCFTDFKSAAIEMKQVLDDIHNLGQAAPTAQQYKVLSEIALKTAVQGTPFWSNDFPALAPSQRKSFGSLVNSWSASIEANIAARLGEKEKAA